MKQLKDLYLEHKGKVSDKWSLYLSTYERLFRKYSDKNISIFEIGVQNGGSLDIWAKYFPHAKKIVGCDINERCKKLIYDDDRISVVVQDANTDIAEKEILNYSNEYDLIIDDGSHRSSDIIKSFFRYFPHLKADGLFVAEDLHCSYWNDFEGGLCAPFSSIAFFKRLVDVINHEHWGVEKKREDILAGFCEEYKLIVKDTSFLSEIHSIEFVNSMCVIKKSCEKNNTLGERTVFGCEATVCTDPSIKNGALCEKRDQSTNKWSMIDKFPEEQIEPLLNKLENFQDKIESINERNNLLKNSIRVINEYNDSLKRQLDVLHESRKRYDNDRLVFEKRYEELQKENQKLENIVVSAKNWQKRSWIKRAFHRWRVPGTNKSKVGFFRKLERSIRKKRNRLLGRDQWKNKAGNDSRYDGSNENYQRSSMSLFCPSDRYKKLEAFKPLVSVIVPNFNHEPFLEERLNSIYSQSYKNIEVILLDDCSSDDSRKILSKYESLYPEKTTLLFNKENGGSPFKQWGKGISQAQGDIVWIAESDDFCDFDFLEKLVPFFRDEAVMLAYCKTVFVDKNGDPTTFSFDHYVSELSNEKWNSDYVQTAHREVNSALAFKNTIPNASSAIFRNPRDIHLLNDEEWQSLKICGDWIFYLHIIRGGKIAFLKEAKNYYRCHGDNSSGVEKQAQPFYYKEHETVAYVVASLYDVSEEVLERNHSILSNHWNYWAEKGKIDWDLNDFFDLDKVRDAKKKHLPNILIVAHDFTGGGAEIFSIRLANVLWDRGYAITFLNFKGLPDIAEFRGNLDSRIPLIERDSDSFNPVDLIDLFGINIVNTHHGSMDVYFSEVCSCLRRKHSNLNVKLITSLHGYYELCDGFLQKNMDSLREVDRWVYVADKNRDYVSKEVSFYNEDQFCKIPIGLNFEKIVTPNRSDFGLSEDSFVVCLASRAIREKGWKAAIRAVQLTREKSGIDVQLLLLGEGEVYEELKKKKLPDYIHLLGFQKEVRNIFSMSDVGILPSVYGGESCPTCLIECLSVGKPVIATDIGEVRNIITVADGNMAGILLPLCDEVTMSQNLSKAIIDYASNSTMYEIHSSFSKKAASKYDIDKIASRYEEVVKDMI